MFMMWQLVERDFQQWLKTTVYLCGFLQGLYNSVAQYDLAIDFFIETVGVLDVLIDLVRSFHCDMKARVWVDGTLLEDIEVTNGFHQGNGCTMAPNLMPAV